MPKNIFKTFTDTMSGKTTRDKVAEAEAKAMGKKPKKKGKSGNVKYGNTSVDYYEG